jgi:hypothetical protein
LGLGVLTRYAGLPLIATGGLGVLLFSKIGFGRRLFNAVLFGIIGILPFALWSLRNTLLVGSSAGRTMAFHPIGMSQLWQAIYTFSSWLQLPEFMPGWLRLIIILLIGGGLLFLVLRPYLNKSHTDTSANSLPTLVKLLLLYIFIYLAFLVVSISLLDANTPLDDRILSSVFIALIVVIVYLLATFWRQSMHKKALGFIFAGLGLIFFFAAFSQNMRWVFSQREQGLGFTSLAWQESDIMAELDDLPEDMSIYSNVPEAIYLHTGKSALSFPKKENATTNQVEANYAEKLLEMRNKLAQDSSVIVFFTAVRPEAGQIITELQAEMPLIIVIETDDGIMYAVNKNSTN